MKKIRHLWLAMLLLVGHTLFAQSVTFKPNAALGQDAQLMRNSVCTNWASTNYGNSSELDPLAWTWYANSCGPGAGRGIIRFDQLSTLPAGAVITYAELRLFGVATSGNSQGNSNYPGSPFPTDNGAWVRRVTSPWAENTVTWASHSTAFTTVDQAVIAPSTTQWNYNVAVDVTNMVTAMMSPGNNNGFIVMLQNENYYRGLLFASSDHPDATRWPELYVKYEVPCDANFTYCNSTQSPGLYNFKVDNPQTGFTYKWDFGDGGSATGTSVSHNYFTGSYQVCLYAYNEETGVKCEKCIKICVNNDRDTTCYVKFKFETPNGYLYYFYGDPVGPYPVASAYWDFGDGTTSTDWPNTKHEYTESGTYKVCLVVKYENGCVAKYCYEIKVQVPCDVKFDYKTDDGYYFKFEGIPVGPSPVVYAEWDFGDGSTATGWNTVDHTYGTPGTYTVCVKVKYENGCVAKFCREVIVGCKVSFDFRTPNDYLYYFYGNEFGPYPVASAEWDFGDGTTSTDWPNTKHEYTKSGKYKVCVTVKYENGCVARFCYEIEVKVPCDVSFKPETADGYLYYFYGIPVGSSPVASAYWDFGDGNTGSGWPIEKHQYEKPGTYKVCLTVKYENGCEARYCYEIKVDCVVDFTYEINDDEIIVHGIPIGPYGVSSVEWHFGDGTVSSSWPDDKNQYATPGTYEVCLVVKYENGCVAKKCYKITVPNPCKVKYEYYFENGIFYFTGHEDGSGVVSAVWDFGDGSPFTAYNTYWPETKHRYRTPGTYRVCVTVTYRTGCVARYCREIKVTQEMIDAGGKTMAIGKVSQTVPGDVIKVIPNPVNETMITVSLTVQDPGNYNFRVLSANGTTMLTGSKQLYKGLQQVQVPVNRLTPGKYWIEFVNNGKHLRAGFVRL